jgi:hypothetical protein
MSAYVMIKTMPRLLLHREMGIITSDSPPDKISENRNWIDLQVL